MDSSAGERVERYSGRVVGRRIIYYQFKEGVQGWMSQGSVEKAGVGGGYNSATVVAGGAVKVKFVNRFWIAGDVQMVAATGATQEVLHFVYSAKEASAFGRATASAIMSFVERRVNNLGNKNPTKFIVLPSENPTGLWIVYGEQEVEIESEL